MATKTVTRYRTRTVKAKARRSRKTTVPLAVAIPAGMLAYEGIKGAIDYGPAKATNIVIKHMTGFDTEDGHWKKAEFYRGGGPLLMGLLFHKLANKLGINRALSSVPYIRI